MHFYTLAVFSENSKTVNSLEKKLLTKINFVFLNFSFPFQRVPLMLDLLLANANGLTVADKYEEFTDILTTYNPEFLALNETLLKSEDTEFLNIKLRSVNYNNNDHICWQYFTRQIR